MVLNNLSLQNLNNRTIYNNVNYTKTPPTPPSNFNFYGAYAYRYTPVTNTNMKDNTPYKLITTPNNNNKFQIDLLNKNLAPNFNYLSVSNKKYIPYDRFGNAPRAFASGDRLSGLRYIMLGFLGIKYWYNEYTKSITENAKLTNNINILSFGGYTTHLVNSIISKFNIGTIKLIYNGIDAPDTDNTSNQIEEIIKYFTDSSFLSNPVPILKYELINTGGKKKHTIKKINKIKNKKTYKKKNLKKIVKQIIKKKTKKILKKYKKTIKKNSKKKLRKTYKK